MSSTKLEAVPPVRVLIVDDSALMRKVLTDILRTEPGIEVVGTSKDGAEAIEETARLKPDVITLDIEMPGRTGLEILPDLLATHNAAVVMISTHTKEGAAITLEALERGAVDFVPKPEKFQLTQLRDARDLIVNKVLHAVHARPKPRKRKAAESSSTKASPEPRSSVAPDLPSFSIPHSSFRCVVIGISTGGPQALGAILPLVEPPTPPIVIVQHMPGAFTGVFAERLKRVCQLDVKEAEDGDKLIASRILVAPGGRHTSIAGTPPKAQIRISDSDPVSGHKPSVDVLFQSAAKSFQAGAFGLIMTGMGRDGVAGCKAIQAIGGLTFGQDEATSAVYGMNKVAFLEGALHGQFSLDKLPALIKRVAGA